MEKENDFCLISKKLVAIKVKTELCSLLAAMALLLPWRSRHAGGGGGLTSRRGLRKEVSVVLLPLQAVVVMRLTWRLDRL